MAITAYDAVLVVHFGLTPVFCGFPPVTGFKRKAIKWGSPQWYEVALTKRYDLLTSCWNVAKGYAAHEENCLPRSLNFGGECLVGEINEKNAQLEEIGARIFAVAENIQFALRGIANCRRAFASAEEQLQAARRLSTAMSQYFNTRRWMFPLQYRCKTCRNLPKHEFFHGEAARRGR